MNILGLSRSVNPNSLATVTVVSNALLEKSTLSDRLIELAADYREARVPQVSRTLLAAAALCAVALQIVGEAYCGAEPAMAREAAALGTFPQGLDDARSVQVLFGQRQQDLTYDGLQTQVTFDFAIFPAFGCASGLRCYSTGGTRDEARYRNPPSRSSPYLLMARVGRGSFPSKSEGGP